MPGYYCRRGKQGFVFRISNKVIIKISNTHTKLKQIQNNNKMSIAIQALFIETTKFSKEKKSL